MDRATRSRRTISPRDALTAAARASLVGQVAKRNGGLSQAAIITATNGPDAPACQLDPKLDARAAARMAIASELENVMACIRHAGSESTPLEERLTAVHQARRGLKRMQALRILVRPGLRNGVRASGNSLRGAKAALAVSRQQDALAKLLEELCSLRGKPISSDLGGHSPKSHLSPSAESLRSAGESLAVAHRAMRIVSSAPLDWHGIVTTLGDSWRSARRVAQANWMGKSEVWLHQSRKEFQRLADQMGLLRACMPSDRYASRMLLRKAADRLGRARDLGILVGTIDTSTREGRALARRAESLRTTAMRAARRCSRDALRHSRRMLMRDALATIARARSR